MSANAISVRGLRKYFQEQVAVDGIDFDVQAGTVFALLGPNGSGKTTIVKILSTLISADEGHAEVAGQDVSRSPRAVRAAIGVTGQGTAVDPWLTGRENLRLVADLHHLERAEGARRSGALLRVFGLLDAADRPVMTYSGGMTRRLDLAMTLLGQPRILFLDEPTTGLDPRSRNDLWAYIRSLVMNGVTVFLTTQYLQEADALADRIGVLDRGRLVAEGTPQELKALVPGGHVRVEFDDVAAFEAVTADLGGSVGTVDNTNLTVTIPCDATLGSLRSVFDGLAAPDGVRITVVQPDLDDVFLSLTEVTR
jgi:ABC-2 type transport system ATP-binding protein